MREQETEIDKVYHRTFRSINDIKTAIISLKDSLIKERLFQIDSTYEQSNKVNYSEIEYLSVKRQKNYGSIEKYIINATILIGWIGTFLGIIQSVKSLNISDNSIQMPLISGIINGLSLAIGASILGIFSSLSLGFLYTAYKNYENNVFTKLEEISILKIVPHYSIVENSLISKAIADSMNRVLPSIIKQSTDDLKEATLNLKGVTEEIKANQQNISTLISQIETSVVSSTENNRQIQVQLKEFNGHINKLIPTLDNIDSAITQNKNEFEQIKSENKANYEVISKTYTTLKEHSDTLKTFSTTIHIDFANFLNDNSKSNEQFKQVVGDAVKTLVKNQAEATNRISQLHDKLVNSIISIEKSRNEVYVRRQESETSSVKVEAKKKKGGIFSFLNRFR